jgi:hypothetical protein
LWSGDLEMTMSRGERPQSRRSGQFLYPVVGVVVGVLAFAALYLLWPGGAVGPARGERLTDSADLSGVDPGPQPVENVTVSAGDKKISVSWSDTSGAPSAAYQVEATQIDERQNSRTCVAETGSCVIEGLTNGVTYAIEVRSVGADGALSAPQRVRATPYPDALTSKSAALWLDADDPSTLRGAGLTVGSPVVEWHDKSGRGYVATQTETTAQPLIAELGERRALEFSGNQSLAFDGTGLPEGAAPSTIFVVARLVDLDPTNSCFAHVLAWGANASAAARSVHKGCETALAYVDTFDTYEAMQPTKPWPEGKTALLSAIVTESRVRVRMDGVSSYSWSAPAGLFVNTAPAQTFTVGGAQWWGNEAGWTGLICEIVILSGRVNAADYRQIEGYLARKWSIEAEALP